MTSWLPWAPLAAAVLHIVEEFVFPGGFADWDRRYRPQFRHNISARFHVLVNGLLLLVCYDAGALAVRPIGIAVWLAVTMLLGTNGLWHMVAAARTRTYSPGMITGALLYLPLTVYGYVHFLRSGQASAGTALLSGAVGASYHLWVGKAIHRWRARGGSESFTSRL